MSFEKATLNQQILERDEQPTDDYWRAFERWASHQPLAERGAAERLSRDEIYSGANSSVATEGEDIPR